MEIRFGFGKGYVASVDQNISDKTIGLIAIDSIYTPLTKVTYDVKNVRIGESNDFEQLFDFKNGCGDYSRNKIIMVTESNYHKHFVSYFDQLQAKKS